MNTTCENLPEVHKLLRAFNAIIRIAAPAVVFKSEAIVHPNFVVTYIDLMECQISYNPLQMALTWEVNTYYTSNPIQHSNMIQALATRDVSMLSQALERRHNLPQGCAWVNYVRSHDDIGWTFSDEDAAELGKHGHDHRRFLNAFYVNRHPGSFARGVPFQDNPRTGDCRISGTTASLAGLEANSEGALGRILLAYSIAMSTGGIPLIYLGDEVGQLNDYSYVDDKAKRGDSRWVNRPEYPSERYAQRHDTSTIPGQLYEGIQKLIKLRKSNEEFAGGSAVGFNTMHSKILGYQRLGDISTVLCLVNFSDHPEWIGRERFMGMPHKAKDLVSGDMIELREAGILLRPHQYMWLRWYKDTVVNHV